MDRQTDGQTHSSQYFATAPMGEVINICNQNSISGKFIITTKNN